MFGPGEYVPDPTEGIVDVQDLPAPKLLAYDRNYKHTPCPRCGHRAARHTSGQRILHDLGDVYAGCPVDLLVAYSSHSCSPCQTYCNIDLSDVAPPRQSLHASGHRHGRASGGRRQRPLPACQLAPVARPSRLCAVCHNPELGGSWGKKRRKVA